ncbi:MAG: hypothetical protein J0M12_06845 [Deltaproteobacteria bacterium]|nr:hypothetical protein [Deltaproteobacteria bacterium]
MPLFRSFLSIAFSIAALLALPSLAFAAGIKILVKPHLAARISSVGHSHAGKLSSVPVRVDFELLKNARRFRIITASGRSMFGRKRKALPKFSLFSDKRGKVYARTFSGQLRRPGEGNFGTFHLTAIKRAAGKPAIAGTFNSAPFSQNIHENASGALELESYHTADMPDCAGDIDGKHIAHDSFPLALPNKLSSAAIDGALTIDIAILLSTEMVDAYGSLAAAQAEAINAVDAANGAYANSEIAQELRLVYAGQTTTVQDPAILEDLYRLQDPTDGAFDEAHSIRDTYGADLVSLFRHESDPTACGIAFTMNSGSISTDFADHGFSAVTDICATGNYSLAHELGHNMGANHDVTNAGGQSAYSYSYGYQFTGSNNGKYRTVMAYASGQSGEVRIPYFSNPDVQYQGVATGTSSANNALTLNNTAAIVAAFRSESELSPEFPPAPTPTPTPAAISFKNVKSSLVKGKCKIVGTVKYVDGLVVSALPVELRTYSGTLLKTASSSSSGKFRFNASRKKKYRLMVDSRLNRAVRCS